jgi:hypothetical protein
MDEQLPPPSYGDHTARSGSAIVDIATDAEIARVLHDQALEARGCATTATTVNDTPSVRGSSSTSCNRAGTDKATSQTESMRPDYMDAVLTTEQEARGIWEHTGRTFQPLPLKLCLVKFRNSKIQKPSTATPSPAIVTRASHRLRSGGCFSDDC